MIFRKLALVAVSCLSIMPVVSPAAAVKAPDIIGLLIDLDRCRSPSRLPIRPARGEQIDNSCRDYQN